MMHQDHLVDNTVDSLGKADLPIQKRMVENLTKADWAASGSMS